MVLRSHLLVVRGMCDSGWGSCLGTGFLQGHIHRGTIYMVYTYIPHIQACMCIYRNMHTLICSQRHQSTWAITCPIISMHLHISTAHGTHTGAYTCVPLVELSLPLALFSASFLTDMPGESTSQSSAPPPSCYKEAGTMTQRPEDPIWDLCYASAVD
jgi:hypothetical protein